jgi:DNA-directed RNA polymerase subunit RPC12/RpoP
MFVWKCPLCGAVLKSRGGAGKRYRNNWCNECGQKIDWSVTAEENKKTKSSTKKKKQ